MQDTFAVWLRDYYGKATAEAAAKALNISWSTTNAWLQFCKDMLMDSLSKGDALPGPDLILAEWRKKYPPAEIRSTAFGDVAVPLQGEGDSAVLSQVTIGELLGRIDELLTRHLGK